MKAINLITLLLIFVGFNNCRKSDGSVKLTSSIEMAKLQFDKEFSDNVTGRHKSFRISEEKSPVWDKSKEITQNGKTTWFVPIKYKKDILVKSNLSDNLYSLNDITFLIVKQEANSLFSFELGTVISKKDTINKAFHGIILVEDWKGNFKYSFKYDGDKKLLSAPDNSTVQTNNTIIIDHYLNGFNYSLEDPDGYAWQEYIGSTYISVPDSYGTGSGSYGQYQDLWDAGLSEATSDVSPINLIVPAGENKISDLTEYTKCFSDGPGVEFEVTLFVEQPVAGTRATWIVYDGSKTIRNGTIYSVGHTFIGITQKGSLVPITRNIGFYPSNAVNPISPKTQGELDNDQDSYFDISITMPITSSQLNSILSYLKNAESAAYNLNTYNCTTFALDCLRSAGINFPRTEGTWPNGKGLNPGDLGEDLRQMKLQPTMIRKTKNENHKNTGTCN